MYPLPCVLCPVWDGEEGREREREDGMRRNMEDWEMAEGRWMRVRAERRRRVGKRGSGRKQHGTWDGGEGREKGEKKGDGKRELEDWDMRDGIFEGMGEKGEGKIERREARYARVRGEWRDERRERPDGRWERA
jgi:hypothetical protein